MSPPEISVVLGTYNRLPFLKAAIRSVRDNGIDVPYEIIVIDGGSTDGSLRWLSKQKDIITIVQHNRGTFRGKPIKQRSWGYFMNLGFKCAQGKYILMISDDSLLVPDSAMNGYHHAESLRAQGRNIGAVAFYWREWPGEKDYKVGFTFGKMFVNHGLYFRKALERVGWIDEERYQFYHADGDLCLRLWKQGFEVVDCLEAYVEHYRHANIEIRQRNMEVQAADYKAYMEQWSAISAHSGNTDPEPWQYRKYTDPYCTVRKFPRGAICLLQILQQVNRLRRLFSSLIRRIKILDVRGISR